MATESNHAEANGAAEGAAGRTRHRKHQEHRPSLSRRGEPLHVRADREGRPGASSSGPTSAGLVVASLADVERIRDELLEALAEARAPQAPALLDRRGLAAALGISPTGVDRLRAEGLPTIMVVESPRFDLADCLAWLKARPR